MNANESVMSLYTAKKMQIVLSTTEKWAFEHCRGGIESLSLSAAKWNGQERKHVTNGITLVLKPLAVKTHYNRRVL